MTQNRRLAKINDAPSALPYQVAARTLRIHAANHKFPLYTMAGVRGVLVDLDEVEAALAKMPHTFKGNPGSYGGAEVTEVPRQPLVVVAVQDQP